MKLKFRNNFTQTITSYKTKLCHNKIQLFATTLIFFTFLISFTTLVLNILNFQACIGTYCLETIPKPVTHRRALSSNLDIEKIKARAAAVRGAPQPDVVRFDESADHQQPDFFSDDQQDMQDDETDDVYDNLDGDIIEEDDDVTQSDGPETGSGSGRAKTATHLKTVKKDDYDIEVYEDNYDTIPVLVYKRSDVTGTGPNQLNGVIFIHGGGWLSGGNRMNPVTGIFESLTKHALIFSVKYRLSTTVAFPGPYTDCLRATKSIITRSYEYSIPQNRFAVMGGSSGANLAVAVALALSNGVDFPKLYAQIILNPALQVLDFNTPSYLQDNEKMLLTRNKMVTYWAIYATGEKYNNVTDIVRNRHVPQDVVKQYLDRLDTSALPNNYKLTMDPGEIEQNRQARLNVPLSPSEKATWERYSRVFMDPRFSPLVANSFSLMPPAIIYAAEHDVLRDDALFYAAQLRKDGVGVKMFHDTDGYHGAFWSTGKDIGLNDALERMFDEGFSFSR